MGLFDKYLRASFEGVYFLVPSETKTGGRKTVSHEYPNSDERYTEDLGRMPAKFTLEAILHGDDVIFERKLLENKLDTADLGILIHPIYGRLEVKATSYSVTSNNTQGGVVRFTINFETSKRNVTATPDVANAAAVSAKADAARTALHDILEDNYEGPTKPLELDNAADSTDNIFSKVFDKVSSGSNLTANGITQFTRKTNNLRDDIFNIVQEPAAIKSAMVDFYAAA